MKQANFYSPSVQRLGTFVVACAMLFPVISGQAVKAQSGCDSRASLVNPSASQAGLVGWWRSLWSGAGAERPEGTETARPGIGGTGIDNGGIGGTGIVGVVTGFASVCVNGIEVHYDEKTPVFLDGRTARLSDLAVGHMVAVRAAGLGQEVSAVSISLVHALVGPVTATEDGQQRLQVMGQRVRNDGAMPLDATAGDWVRVSGLRTATGEWIATRVEKIAPQAQVRMAGWAEQVAGTDFALNGIKVTRIGTAAAVSVRNAQEVSVQGQWSNGVLVAQSIDIEPSGHAIGQVERVVLEGYLYNVGSKTINLGGRAVALNDDVQISGNDGAPLAANQRVRVSGRIDATNRLTASRVEVESGRGSGSSRRDGRKSGSKSESGESDDSGGSVNRSGSDDSSGSGSKSGFSDSGSTSGSSGSGGGGGGSGSGSGKGK